MNIYSETTIIEKVSQRQHGLKTLKRIQEVAANSIGVTVSDDLLFAEKLTMFNWLNICPFGIVFYQNVKEHLIY